MLKYSLYRFYDWEKKTYRFFRLKKGFLSKKGQNSLLIGI